MRFHIATFMAMAAGARLSADSIAWSTDAFFTKCPTANGAGALTTNFTCKAIDANDGPKDGGTLVELATGFDFTNAALIYTPGGAADAGALITIDWEIERIFRFDDPTQARTGEEFRGLTQTADRNSNRPIVTQVREITDVRELSQRSILTLLEQDVPSPLIQFAEGPATSNAFALNGHQGYHLRQQGQIQFRPQGQGRIIFSIGEAPSGPNADDMFRSELFAPEPGTLALIAIGAAALVRRATTTPTRS